MATPPLDASAPAAPRTGALYERWRSEPQYRLSNLAGDPEAWRVVPLDTLELLAFDQCLVFGAVCPDSAAVDRAARRDRVVKQSRDTLFAIFDCVTKRMSPARRLALMRGVACAVEQDISSPAALLPFTRWDDDPSVRAAAARAAHPAPTAAG
jgi:hypothetical protein